jgi:hypothetical protein
MAGTIGVVASVTVESVPLHPKKEKKGGSATPFLPHNVQGDLVVRIADDLGFETYPFDGESYLQLPLAMMKEHEKQV